MQEEGRQNDPLGFNPARGKRNPRKSQGLHGMDGLGVLVAPSCTGMGVLLEFSWDLILLQGFMSLQP